MKIINMEADSHEMISSFTLQGKHDFVTLNAPDRNILSGNFVTQKRTNFHSVIDEKGTIVLY